MSLTVDIIGYNYKENKDFSINRPNGSGNYLFLFFSTQVHLILEGQHIITNPNSIILFSPNYPQHYSNPIDGFTNDWIHISGDSFKELIDSLNIPFNKPFYIPNYNFIRLFVKSLGQEFLLKDLGYKQNINGLLTTFFVQLARQYHLQYTPTTTSYMAELKEQFNLARVSILSNHQKPWTIDTMSELVGLSRSRFSILYKDFFGVSPHDDLLKERLLISKYLLISSPLSVQEVALKVGFSNLYHFSKQFKKSLGVPPGKYRQHHILQQ